MISLPDKKYHIIYADPPWQYTDKKKEGRTKCGAENHYPCMSTVELCSLPIKKIAEDNAVLFLWATFPMIWDALPVILNWGFRYKTLGFSWIKTNKDGTPWFGVGAYAKSNCEVCLMATRGKVGRLIKGVESDPKDILRVQTNHVSSVIMSPRSEHSRKPVEVRDRIVELFGDISRIELFARQQTPGWDVWGNQIQDGN